MQHNRVPSKPSPKVGFPSLICLVVVIAGGITRLTAAYYGGDLLYWTSAVLMIGGMFGVAITGIAAAKRSNRGEA